jgi:hypothetical protein
LRRSGASRLVDLGPAFFTKVLYFAGWDKAAGDHRPLIPDRCVVLALNEQAGLGWRSGGNWSSAQYAEYLALADQWADAWGTAPDVVEKVLFKRGQEIA